MSDTREVRAALELAQARVKALERERAATSTLQADRDKLREAVAAAAARISTLEAELATLRPKRVRPADRDRLELLAEVNRLTHQVESLQRPELQAELTRLRAKVRKLEEKLAASSHAGSQKKLDEVLRQALTEHAVAIEQVAAERRRLTGQLAEVQAERERLTGQLAALEAERDRLAAELTALRAKLKEITTERNQLRAYAPRR